MRFVLSRSWYVRVLKSKSELVVYHGFCYSMGLHTVFFVRASRDLSGESERVFYPVRTVSSASCAARPRSAPLWKSVKFSNMYCIKMVYISKRRRSSGQQPIKNAFCPIHKPRIIPGHALHEKGLQRQISVGTLVSSQERRALAVPLINRSSTELRPQVNR